mmetsp:Transcript_113280/g.315408  ORF Transcript_113280/g.315408 Transcript_113280/m.315408 type:complete len:234 (+) Transcript_113280:71-772(+)
MIFRVGYVETAVVKRDTSRPMQFACIWLEAKSGHTSTKADPQYPIIAPISDVELASPKGQVPGAVELVQRGAPAPSAEAHLRLGGPRPQAEDAVVPEVRDEEVVPPEGEGRGARKPPRAAAPAPAAEADLGRGVPRPQPQHPVIPEVCDVQVIPVEGDAVGVQELMKASTTTAEAKLGLLAVRSHLKDTAVARVHNVEVAVMKGHSARPHELVELAALLGRAEVHGHITSAGI